MATHSSVLAWRIPGIGEPGGLPSTGSQRVGHDWNDLAAASYLHHDMWYCIWARTQETSYRNPEYFYVSAWLGHRWWVQRYSGCVFEDVWGWDEHLNWESRLPSLTWAGLIHATEALNRSRRPALLRWESSSCLALSKPGHRLFSYLQTQVETLTLPRSWAFRLRVHLTLMDFGGFQITDSSAELIHTPMSQYISYWYTQIPLVLFLWRP